MALIGWVDTVQLVEDWPDAPDSDAEVERLCNAAYFQLSAYAPAPSADPAPAPEAAARAEAQTLQVKHLWAREKAGNGSGYGAEGYMIQTYPLVMEARNLLRPKRGPLAFLGVPD